MRHITTMAVGVVLLGACVGDVVTVHSSEVEITEVAVADLPETVASLIAEARSDFQPLEIEKKVREGRTYYDIEGEVGDGSELEFDVLMTDAGPEIVEIQRDLAFGDIPQTVRDLALQTSDGAEPARIIESVQTDGAIIYEFFADGQPSDPAYEIRMEGGVPTLLDERWVH